jgi:hypothetical protein
MLNEILPAATEDNHEMSTIQGPFLESILEFPGSKYRH